MPPAPPLSARDEVFAVFEVGGANVAGAFVFAAVARPTDRTPERATRAKRRFNDAESRHFDRRMIFFRTSVMT